jgi:hypothetical protein
MWRLFVADFDLGSVPWAVEAAAQRFKEYAATWGDAPVEDAEYLIPELLAAFLSARGPCPNPECRGGYIESLDPRLMDPLVRTPCPDCLGSPGSGPTIAEKLT